MRIVITDSGLGGLSVLAELESRFVQNPFSENIELIFANALYSSGLGYNSMSGIEEKANVFNNFLFSINNKYNPDLILIACNTLSVVYPHTEFAKRGNKIVKGIVEGGTELFTGKMKSNSGTIILFGTPTTINSNVYKDKLIQSGVLEHQIINQSCPNLETEIQKSPKGETTRTTISKFVNVALNKLNGKPNKIFAGLCCTHYGYSKPIFEEEFRKKISCEFEILNPNGKMIDFLFADKLKQNKNYKMEIKIVSRVNISDGEITALSAIFKHNSPKTASALEKYELDYNLFSI